MRVVQFQRRLMLVMTACILIFSILTFLYPVYWLLTVSVKTQKEAFKIPPSWIFQPIFKHYIKLFAQANFFHYFLNSTIVSFGTTVAALGIGAPAAYALSRGKFKSKNWILLAILGTRMAPPILFIIPFFILYAKLGLIDTRIGLIIVFLSFNLALVVWSMHAFFDDIPLNLEEAAWIDGASEMQSFTKVVLPLASPGLAATGVLCMILTWNEFLFALILTRVNAVTAPVAVVRFASYEAADWGLVAAGSIVLTLPVLFFSLLVRRYLTRGLLGGALKG